MQKRVGKDRELFKSRVGFYTIPSSLPKCSFTVQNMEEGILSEGP